jgi:hypothetical protein
MSVLATASINEKKPKPGWKPGLGLDLGCYQHHHAAAPLIHTMPPRRRICHRGVQFESPPTPCHHVTGDIFFPLFF